jgi:hypothetical protein
MERIADPLGASGQDLHLSSYTTKHPQKVINNVM